MHTCTPLQHLNMKNTALSYINFITFSYSPLIEGKLLKRGKAVRRTVTVNKLLPRPAYYSVTNNILLILSCLHFVIKQYFVK